MSAWNLEVTLRNNFCLNLHHIFIERLRDDLMSEESIAAQLALIVTDVCAFAPHPVGCEIGFTKYWESMGKF